MGIHFMDLGEMGLKNNPLMLTNIFDIVVFELICDYSVSTSRKRRRLRIR